MLLLSTSPSRASDAVLCAVALLQPLPYSGDVHPLLTVQDPELPSLALLGAHAGFERPAVAGTTNPFLVKALSVWPNVVAVAEWRGGGGWRWGRVYPAVVAKPGLRHRLLLEFSEQLFRREKEMEWREGESKGVKVCLWWG